MTEERLKEILDHAEHGFLAIASTYRKVVPELVQEIRRLQCEAMPLFKEQ